MWMCTNRFGILAEREEKRFKRKKLHRAACVSLCSVYINVELSCIETYADERQIQIDDSERTQQKEEMFE